MSLALAAPPRTRSRAALVAALLLIGAAWGGTVPLVQISVTSGLSPLLITLWEIVYSIALLSAACAVTGRWPRRTWRWAVLYAAIGGFGTVVPGIFTYWAADHLPGGVLALVLATVPMFTLVIAVAVGTDTFSPARLFGLVLALAGIAVLVLPGEALPDAAEAIFILVALGSTLCYAVESNVVARFVPPAEDAIATLLGACIAGLAMALPLTLLFGRYSAAPAPWNVGAWGAAEWAIMAITALHVVAYSGYLWLMGRAGPIFTSQVGPVVTVAGVVFSAWFLGEENSAWIWLSLVLLVGGLMLVRPRETDAP